MRFARFNAFDGDPVFVWPANVTHVMMAAPYPGRRESKPPSLVACVWVTTESYIQLAPQYDIAQVVKELEAAARGITGASDFSKEPSQFGRLYEETLHAAVREARTLLHKIAEGDSMDIRAWQLNAQAWISKYGAPIE